MNDIIGMFRKTLEFEGNMLGTPETCTISRALELIGSAYELGWKQSYEQELRERYAGMAMQAIISDHETIKELVNLLQSKGDTKADGLERSVAQQSIYFADALVEQLKK